MIFVSFFLYCYLIFTVQVFPSGKVKHMPFNQNSFCFQKIARNMQSISLISYYHAQVSLYLSLFFNESFVQNLFPSFLFQLISFSHLTSYFYILINFQTIFSISSQSMIFCTSVEIHVRLFCSIL